MIELTGKNIIHGLLLVIKVVYSILILKRVMNIFIFIYFTYS